MSQTLAWASVLSPEPCFPRDTPRGRSRTTRDLQFLEGRVPLLGFLGPPEQSRGCGRTVPLSRGVPFGEEDESPFAGLLQVEVA
jgi:hypothetical protein